ncbi:hypothetical protein HN615_02405 [Candidatus Woesearchaeota archaeon]|jgi:hypothetical protein|nr:hypothetical protein [Candidatus Neomarinimicrobiota bacterium]MBT7555764.1 hypothetical protein [Candidatus Woesearchaeota archaeon]
MSEVSNFFTILENSDKRTNIPSTISSPVWSGGAATLTSFYTGSTQSGSSGDYYYDVYDKAGSDSTRQVQFAVSYGHIEGSGSLSTSAGNNPTKAIYRQVRNICIKNASSETRFNFNADGDGTSYEAADVFAIGVNRARYREKIDPGNWELHLTKGGNTLKLIDDSGATSDSTVNASQRVFNIVSGSISGGTATIKTTAVAQSATNGSFGYFYPELGIIVLNAYALNQDSLAITLTRSTATNDNTAYELVSSISTGAKFQARREEQIKSSHYFCRVRSDEYNWSQNPTYYTGSNAELRNPTFIQDPKSYITTVGLYNDNNELLAVAKLSQPLLKSRDREAVIKVRLDF